MKVRWIALLMVETAFRLTGKTRSSCVGFVVPAPFLLPFLFWDFIERLLLDDDLAKDITQTLELLLVLGEAK